MKIGGKKVKTIKRAMRPGEAKNVQRAFFVFEATLTAADGTVYDGWWWTQGTSLTPEGECTGPFKTEQEAAEHADANCGMIQ
jgi:hypothetical protein